MATISAKDTIPGPEAANLYRLWLVGSGLVGGFGPGSRSGAGSVAALLPVSDAGCGSAVSPHTQPSSGQTYISPVCHLPLCSGVICIDRRGRCAEGNTLKEAVQAGF